MLAGKERDLVFYYECWQEYSSCHWSGGEVTVQTHQTRLYVCMMLWHRCICKFTLTPSTFHVLPHASAMALFVAAIRKALSANNRLGGSLEIRDTTEVANILHKLPPSVQ